MFDGSVRQPIDAADVDACLAAIPDQSGCRHRDLLPAQLRQQRARAACAGARRGRPAGLFRMHIVRRVAAVPRGRTLRHHGAERLYRSAHATLSGYAERGVARPILFARPVHHDLKRRRFHLRTGEATARLHRAVRPSGRRRGLGPIGRAARISEFNYLRHGRHQHRRLPDRAVAHPGDRSAAHRRLCQSHAADRDQRGRRRRRFDRMAGARRHAHGRPAQCRRRTGTRLLSPRRNRTHGDRRQSGTESIIAGRAARRSYRARSESRHRGGGRGWAWRSGSTR